MLLMILCLLSFRYRSRSLLVFSFNNGLEVWCERLSKFLIENDFSKRKIDTILLIKHVDQDLLLVQIYVDDIIFGSTNETLCEDFSTRMQ